MGPHLNSHGDAHRLHRPSYRISQMALKQDRSTRAQCGFVGSVRAATAQSKDQDEGVNTRIIDRSLSDVVAEAEQKRSNSLVLRHRANGAANEQNSGARRRRRRGGAEAYDAPSQPQSGPQRVSLIVLRGWVSVNRIEGHCRRGGVGVKEKVLPRATTSTSKDMFEIETHGRGRGCPLAAA